MLNNVTLQGNLGADPELRTTPAGKSVTTLTLACTRDFGPDGNKETDWFDVVCWGTTAEFVVRNFRKGQSAIVTGRLQVRSWNDKDGNKRRTTEVVANNVYFCGKKENGTESHQRADSGASVPAYGEFTPPAKPAQDFQRLDDDDAKLPF